MVDNLQLVIWLEYAEKSINRAITKATNRQVKHALEVEVQELRDTLNHYKKAALSPTPLEAEIIKKKT